ncbi:hypothetical protein A8990_15312 [Paenibacillus taihuensis]|uniref:Uncharacterized protein n=1 Tax=Paenibacillus taihuensis TaxID=1156355 RepID=A0A3D9Q432_9BACL|nr:hypothetical protein A8990_15312 [Paenibacillus taihuensis]
MERWRLSDGDSAIRLNQQYCRTKKHAAIMRDSRLYFAFMKINNLFNCNIKCIG